MARKKKEPIVINPTELVPTTIGEMKEKESGPWVSIFIIVLLLVGIFFLDDIREFIENGGLQNLSNFPLFSDKTPVTGDQTEEPIQETKYYEISKNETVPLEKFELNTLTLNGKDLSFQIDNLGGANNYFLSHDYYMEFYDKDKKLLERIKIDPVNITTSHTFHYELKSSDIIYYTIHFMNEEDYPAIVLKKKDGVSYLQCKKEENTYVYFFDKDNKLTQVEYDVDVLDSNPEYENLFDEYLDLVDENSNMDGVESDVTTSEEGFTYFVRIALSTIGETNYRTKFTNTEFYPAQTIANKVAFELENLDYACE